MTVRVRLLGRPRVAGPEGAAQPCPQPRGQKSWAVLARVALAGRPVSRRELAAALFADAEDPLGALRWSLADLRRCLGTAAFRTDPLVLPADLVVDALAPEAAPAAELGGTLLDGMDLRNSPEFDTWLLLERARCARRSREALRSRALSLLAAGTAADAVDVAGRAAELDPLDEDAQELFLRALVAAGFAAQAAVHVAKCTATFAREGLGPPSPALLAAARPPRPSSRLRAGVVAASLLRAGSAALAAGAPDAGVETLRRAADEADRAQDPALDADVLTALGGALVHAVRGSDGEGAVVLHRALAAARRARRPALAAEVLRELAFVDVQAGRHTSAERSLEEATELAGGLDDAGLDAGILAIRGLNAADRGRHRAAAALLTESATTASAAGRGRQRAWSLGLLSRSLLLTGDLAGALAAADASVETVQRERWTAFLPWPQAIRAHALAGGGEWRAARSEAEGAYALACEIGDPCWEGMAGRALGLVTVQRGDLDAAAEWLTEARQRCDRVSDRYVWVSAYVGLAAAELAVARGDGAAAAARLHDDAVRTDLPEFLAWALVLQAEAGDAGRVPLARAAAAGIDNPALQRRLAVLAG